VNDGKLVRRLRTGGDVTLQTAQRVRTFIESERAARTGSAASTPNGAQNAGIPSPARLAAMAVTPTPVRRAAAHAGGGGSAAGAEGASSGGTGAGDGGGDPEGNFRFYDNRQKYLMFVHTCSEKWVVASRVAKELENIAPRPPAVRLFDAGVGDGT